MRILGLTKLVHAAAATMVIVSMTAGDALAWRGRGSSGSSGSSGSYGSYGGSSGSSGSYASSGSSGSSGSHGRMGLFARWHARKASHGSSGSSASYGSSGGYGSSGSSGSSGSWGSHGGYGGHASSGSYGSSGGYYEVPAHDYGPADAQPMMEVAPEASPTPPTPPQAEQPQASIRVNVPADAIVFVNERPTTSTGANRHYISRGLMAGRTYAYNLRVEYEREGKPIIENKMIRLQTGATVELTFGNGEQMAEETEPAKTQVTLHVPAEAKVTLAGANTRQTGEVRTFLTSGLEAGQKWDGYLVRVELERDGQTLVEEKNLSIEGGENYELTFDFSDSAKIAAVN